MIAIFRNLIRRRGLRRAAMSRLERNREYLKRLSDHIEANPDTRFWQALRNISGWGYILARGYDDDTFYWEGFTGREAE